jgi:hypothetical protein
MRFSPRRPGAGGSGRHTVLAACLAIAACATDTAAPNQPKVVRNRPLTPYDFHEECLRLAVGDHIEYDFSTTEPVAFNIHYHEGDAVLEPVVLEQVRADSGIFVPRIAQDYCLMWEAGPAGAVLDYRVRRRAAAR